VLRSEWTKLYSLRSTRYALLATAVMTIGFGLIASAVTVSRWATMSVADKAKNTGEKAAGKVKEEVGKITDDKSMQAEGRTDQAKGDLKNAGEKVKDAFKN